MTKKKKVGALRLFAGLGALLVIAGFLKEPIEDYFTQKDAEEAQKAKLLQQMQARKRLCKGTTKVIVPQSGRSRSVNIPNGCDFITRHDGPITMINVKTGEQYTNRHAAEDPHLAEDLAQIAFESESGGHVTVYVDLLPYRTLAR